MGRALPDDVPIEARMVTKAIERAQHTVEGRNAETRKELLKYDEVRNEQRKVIYQRRLQIIDGEDLKAHTEALLTATVDRVVANHCPNDFNEEWDLDGLLVELTQYYPTRFTVEDLEAATSVAQLTESILDRGPRVLRRARADLPRRSRDRPRDRAQRPDPDHRPALAGAPRGDGLPERRHPPPRDRADRPARGLAARGIRDVRQADGLDRRRLPALCHARPGSGDACRGTRLRPGRFRGRGRPGGWPRRACPGSCRRARRGRESRASCRPWAGPGPAASSNPRSQTPPGAGPGGSGRPPTQGHAEPGRHAGAGAGQRRPPGGPISPTGARVLGGPPAKVGRNEPCWCGSGRKFKVCHGAS